MVKIDIHLETPITDEDQLITAALSMLLFGVANGRTNQDQHESHDETPEEGIELDAVMEEGRAN